MGEIFASHATLRNALLTVDSNNRSLVLEATALLPKRQAQLKLGSSPYIEMGLSAVIMSTYWDLRWWGKTDYLLGISALRWH